MVKKIIDPTSICSNREVSPHAEFAIAVDDKKIKLEEKDDWQKRLSPPSSYSKNHYLYSDGDEADDEEEEGVKKKIDLVEERKKYKSKPEDKVILPEQVETGKTLDSAFHKELMLRNNPQEFPIADYTKILYRLPLNEKQMGELHSKLISKA